MTTNPVILFVNGAEKPEIVSLIGEFNQIGLQYTTVDLAVRTDYVAVLQTPEIVE
jgi:hypothetical protein